MSGGICVWGVSVEGGFCPRRSLSGGSLSRGSLSLGVSVRETPPYGNVRAVRNLLECILFIAAFTLIEEEKEKAFKEFQERKERVRRRQLYDRQQKLKELGRSGLDQCVQDDAGS